MRYICEVPKPREVYLARTRVVFEWWRVVDENEAARRSEKRIGWLSKRKRHLLRTIKGGSWRKDAFSNVTHRSSVTRSFDLSPILAGRSTIHDSWREKCVFQREPLIQHDIVFGIYFERWAAGIADTSKFCEICYRSNLNRESLGSRRGIKLSGRRE